MLLPRFSIKLIFGVTALCAVVAYVGSHAVQNKSWALGVIAAVVLFAATIVVHAGLFMIAWLMSSVLGLARPVEVPKSPFAGAQPPPQIIEPPDLDA